MEGTWFPSGKCRRSRRASRCGPCGRARRGRAWFAQLRERCIRWHSEFAWRVEKRVARCEDEEGRFFAKTGGSMISQAHCTAATPMGATLLSDQGLGPED